MAGRVDGAGAVLASGSGAWANLAVAGTEVLLAADADGPKHIKGDRKALVLVHNPSAETSLTVIPRAVWTDDASNTRKADLPTIAVGIGETIGRVVEGLEQADGFEVVATNDTAVGAAGTFTARCQVRRV